MSGDDDGGPVGEDGYAALRSEYAALAAAYDERWSAYVQRTAAETVSAMDISHGDSVLDVGCGSGVLLEMLLSAHGHISAAGVDLSRRMLDVARQRLGDDVQLFCAQAESLPLDDASHGHVVSANMLHFVRAPQRALEEWRRVLHPGGRIVITDWCADAMVGRLRDWWLRMGSSGHVRTYRSAELVQMLGHAGFADAKVRRYSVGYRWPMMIVTARS